MNVHYRDVLVTHLDDSWINYFILGLAKILKHVNHEYHLACDNEKTNPLLKPFISAYNVKNSV
jgi:hypothetical protein